MKFIPEVKLSLELSRLFLYEAGPYPAKHIYEASVLAYFVLLRVHHRDFSTINLDSYHTWWNLFIYIYIKDVTYIYY
jgi:hypothetical protein